MANVIQASAPTVKSLDINDKAGKFYRMIHGHARVTSVIFIPREELCVAGDDRGYIHVCTCLPLDEIKSFKATSSGSVQALAVHPTCPYLLSGCDDDAIEIWDWEKGWACSRKVQTGYGITRATFNPMDANTFVTSHFIGGGLIKVWSINPSDHQPIRTTECPPDLLKHDHVFTEAAGRNHVVVLNRSKDLQIWDLQTGTRVHKLRDLRFNYIHAVACHPTLPLIAGVGCPANGAEVCPAVCFWNSTNYRLEKTVWCTRNIRYLGFVGSTRLVIGYDMDIDVLEIDMESLGCHQ